MVEKLEQSSENVENALVSVRRVGPKKNTARPLIVKFSNPDIRRSILKNSFKLKNHKTTAGKKKFSLSQI